MQRLRKVIREEVSRGDGNIRRTPRDERSVFQPLPVQKTFGLDEGYHENCPAELIVP